MPRWYSFGFGLESCDCKSGSAEESDGRESADERCAACEGSCILVNCAGFGGTALVGIFCRGSLRRLCGPFAIFVPLEDDVSDWSEAMSVDDSAYLCFERHGRRMCVVVFILHADAFQLI
jgi:hypothetical protein